MPTIHPASGMFGIEDPARMAIDRAVGRSRLLTASQQAKQEKPMHKYQISSVHKGKLGNGNEFIDQAKSLLKRSIVYQE